MYQGQTVFSQVMGFLPQKKFPPVRLGFFSHCDELVGWALPTMDREFPLLVGRAHPTSAFVLKSLIN